MKVEKINDESLTVKLPTMQKMKLPTHPNLSMDPYILAAFFGERGSGKTSLCAYILSLIAPYQQKIFWFSSTVGHDEKVQKMLEPFADKVEYIDEFNATTLGNALDEMLEMSDDYLEHRAVCIKLAQRYKRMGAKKYYDTLENYLIHLYEIGEIKNLDLDYTHEIPPSQPQFSIIVDDELSNPLLMARTSKNNEFLKMVIKHRHFPYYCNVFLLLQNYSSLSNVIRRNLQQFFISGAISDSNLLKFIFAEVSTLFRNDWEAYLNAIKYVSTSPHSFLFVNKNTKEIRKDLNEKIIL